MPTADPQYDFVLRDGNGSYGYMLVREPRTRGRAWQRTGVSDSLSTQRRTVRGLYGAGEEYGGLPAELDSPEVYDDFSGGYGHYRRMQQSLGADRDNHYHIGWNWDTRFAGIAFHAQKPNLLGAFYASLQDADSFVDMPPNSYASGPPAGFGAIGIVGRNYFAVLHPTNLAYSQAAAFAVGFNSVANKPFGHRAAVFGSLTVVPTLDGSSFYYRTHDGGTFTQNASGVPARWFCVASGRLWRGHSNNLVQSCAANTDPTLSGNWSGTIALANGWWRSEDAAAFEDNIFIGFPDGLYEGNATGTFNNVATDVGLFANQENVRDITIHNGQLIFAEGAHVWGYKPAIGANSTLRQLWPNVDIRPAGTLAPPADRVLQSLRGQVRAVKGFGRFLYAGVFNGSQSQIFCGIDASAPGPYVWHPMQLFQETTKVSRIHVDGVTSASDGTQIPQRIWVATDPTFGAQAGCTSPIYYWPIPRADESPFADTQFSPNYCASAYMELPVSDWDAPGTWKLWRKIEVWSEKMGNGPNTGGTANSYLINMLLDGTLIGVPAGNNQITQAPKGTIYFDNSQNRAIGQSGQVTVTSTISGTASTPMLRAVVVRGSERPRTNDTITAKVSLATDLHDKSGALMRDAVTQWNELHGFATNANPMQLIDLIGATMPVVVLPPVEQEESYQQGSDVPEMVATLKIGVLDASWSAFGVVTT